jgi:hypothetical protein
LGTSAAKDKIVNELEALSAKRLTPCLSLVIAETADYLFALSPTEFLKYFGKASLSEA